MRADWFFPESCHPRLTRRAVLAGAAAWVAAGARPGRAGTRDADGTSIVRRHAVDPADPWRLAHGIRAMGREFEAEGGRRAVDRLLETYVASLPAGTGTALGFDATVEVHPDSFLKTLLEAGVPRGHEFTHQGKRHTVEDLVEGAHARFRPAQVGSKPNALPWSIIALTLTTSPLRGRWTNGWGEPVDLDAVVEKAFRLLDHASLPLARARREHRPLAERAPVHSFTCGGTHMLYSLLVAVHAGFRGRDRPERLRRHVDLLVWRLSADLDLIDRFYKERTGSGAAFWYELDTKLKLLGHAQECLAFGMKRGIVSLTPAQEVQRAEAVTTLRKMLEDLEGRNLAEARAVNAELYRQIVGDTCHARRGLTFQG